MIKFTGKYDKEWIRELNEFGRPYYDANRNEWLLKWKQLTVDSLSDYFSSRGVEVIVKKREVSGVLKELRDRFHSRLNSTRTHSYQIHHDT